MRRLIKSYKIKLHPNKEQQELIFKSFGTARFAYNWALETQIKNHESGGKFISDGDLRKEFTQFKKLKGNEWIKEVNNNVTKQAIKDCCKAYKNFFKGQTKFPKFKSKRKSKLSFYVDTHKICFNESQVKMETIGVIDLAESNRIPIGCKYYNPRVSFDGVNFWLSIGCEVDDIVVNNNKTEPIGIDMGIKTLMVCSNGLEFKAVDIKREEKKLKRLQKRASKHYESMRKNQTKIKSKNLIKLETQIKKCYIRISNLRSNSIHQYTTKLVKLNPSHIIIEDLNVSGMMKNRHLSKKIAHCSFYEIRRQLEYKCLNNGIKLIVADRWFPSTKTCSCCGSVKDKMSLSQRTYSCDECGIELDRDFNASLNLKNLAISQ